MTEEITKKQLFPEKRFPATLVSIITILVATAITGSGIYFFNTYISKQKEQFVKLEQQITSLQENNFLLSGQIEAQKVANQQTVQVQNDPTELTDEQKKEADELKQLLESKTPLNAIYDRFSKEIEQQMKNTEENYSLKLIEIDSKIATQSHQIDIMKRLVDDFVPGETKHAQLIMIDVLVKSADSILLQNQDIPSAIHLLKIARESLNYISGADLRHLKQVLDEDLQYLSGLKPIDIPAINKKLNDLLNELIMLPEKAANQISVNPEFQNTHVSSSEEDWKKNLKNNVNGFVSQFFSAKKREDILGNTEKCLQKANSENEKQQCYVLAALEKPGQLQFVRENIRSQIALIMQAALAHNSELYLQGLNQIEHWIKIYFEEKNAKTTQFLDSIQTLKKIPIDYMKEILSLNILSTDENKILSQNAKLIEASNNKAETSHVPKPAEIKPEPVPAP